MRRLDFMAFFFAMVLPTVAFAQGTLTASPTTVVTPAGVAGSTTLNWNVTSAPYGIHIYVHMDGGAGIDITGNAGKKGSSNPTWIIAGSTYVFKLYRSTQSGSADLSQVVLSVTVQGVLPIAPSISASPTTVTIPAGSSVGSTSIAWNAPGYSGVFVYATLPNQSTVDITTLTAPTGAITVPWLSAGAYLFKLYGANANGTANTSLALASASVIAVASGVGADGANFVGQSGMPSTLFVGQTINANVTMRNTGTTTWTHGLFWLGSQNPAINTTWGTARIDLPIGTSVAPNQDYTFSFPATAPPTVGNYNFQWQMVHSNVSFGSSSANLSPTVTQPSADTCQITTSNFTACNARIADGSASSIRFSGTITCQYNDPQCQLYIGAVARIERPIIVYGDPGSKIVRQNFPEPIYSDSGLNLIIVDNASDVTLRDLDIEDGNDSSFGASDASLRCRDCVTVYPRNNSNVKMERVKIENSRQFGVWIVSASVTMNEVTINNAHQYGVAVSKDFPGGSVQISNSYFNDTWSAAVSLSGENSFLRGSHLNNNHRYLFPDVGGGQVVAEQRSQDVTIEDNDITNGVHVGIEAGSPNVNNVKISNNRVGNHGATAIAIPAGIGYVLVSGNILTNNRHNFDGVAYATFIGNTCDGNPCPPGATNPGGTAYYWTSTGQLRNTLWEAKGVCTGLGKNVPTVAQFNADKLRANQASTTLQTLYAVPSQLHWLDAACTANVCTYYRPAADLADSTNFPNNAQGIGNSGWGAYVICVN